MLNGVGTGSGRNGVGPAHSHVLILSGRMLRMTAILAVDGKITIPPQLAGTAQFKPGDTLDVQLYKGTILLRKHQPLAPEQCADLLERSRSQPAPTPEDDAAVEQAVQDVRSRRR